MSEDVPLTYVHKSITCAVRKCCRTTACVLQSVIDFFNSRLDSISGGQAAAPEGQAEWSVGRVLELVQTFAQVGRQPSS
jgi:hypothetical protein